ncbi:hypothetical protein TeGR_g1408 [Tetraparma gracilis]|uniref:UBA domain-containing protein n=1 Tax=Tetraparma gracilis TaxID=2962635 RepID=A0ABQ6MR55_9STRA|nr:hypothetical protein TeGR_g1408 [Tetraparma gracilis]
MANTSSETENCSNRRILFHHQGLVAAVVDAVLRTTSCALEASALLVWLAEVGELRTLMLSDAKLLDTLFHGASQKQTSENCFASMCNLCYPQGESIYNHARFAELGVPRCNGWEFFLVGRAAGVKLADQSFAALEQALVHRLPTIEEEWKRVWLHNVLTGLTPLVESEAASKIAAAEAADAAAAALLGELEATDEAAKSARAKKARKKERKRKSAEKKKREAEEEGAGREELTPFQQWEMSEQAHQLEQRKRTRNLEEAAAIMLAAGSPSPPPFKRGKTADDIEAQIQALGMPPTFPASVSYERDAEAVASDAKIESVLAMVEREAAEEMAAKIAALPDDPLLPPPSLGRGKIESDAKIERVLAMVEREAAEEMAAKIAALPDDPPLPPPSLGRGKIESDAKIERVLAMVEREAAEEMAAKIAALPDDPPLPPPPHPRRELGGRAGSLQAAVHALSVSLLELGFASLAELEAELGRSDGGGGLLESVATLRGAAP